jgi:hypothetical protein
MEHRVILQKTVACILTPAIMKARILHEFPVGFNGAVNFGTGPVSVFPGWPGL